MHKIFRKIKQLIATSVTVLVLSMLGLQTARADALADEYLYYIQNYIYSILGIVNLLPIYLAELPSLATSLLASDDSSNDPVDWSSNWSNQQTWVNTLNQ